MKTKQLFAILTLAAGMAATQAKADLSDVVIYHNPFTGEQTTTTIPEDATEPSWHQIGVSPTTLPDQAFVLTEPGLGSDDQGYVSDVILVMNHTLYITSDDENGNLPQFLPDGTTPLDPFGVPFSFTGTGTPPRGIEETGGLQDVSGFFLLDPLNPSTSASLAPGSLLVLSDVAVPEPSTYGLIAGIGLLALSLFRVRKTIRLA